MYRIVVETEDYVLIDKYPGYSVHKDQEDAGLAMQLKAERGYDELMPVHRLDKVTSGLMLFARHHAAASELSRAFSEHQVEKYYLALSDKKPKKKQKSKKSVTKSSESNNSKSTVKITSTTADAEKLAKKAAKKAKK